MKIDRKKHQGGKDVALNRLRFCLNAFVRSNRKIEKVFEYSPVKDCKVEEMVGAMVASEQVLLEMKEDKDNKDNKVK